MATTLRVMQTALGLVLGQKGNTCSTDVLQFGYEKGSDRRLVITAKSVVILSEM